MVAGPYELYLIRHGVAEPRGPLWPDDSKRPLTESGIDRMRKSARGLARLGVTLDVVLTSPLARAKQTAEIVAAAFEPKPHLVNVESLAPGETFAAVLADVEKHARRRRIALVGHEPDMGALAGRLIGTRHPVEFKKGAVCRIDVEKLPLNGTGILRWFLTPRVLRSVRK